MHELKAAYPEPVKFILFNTSLIVEADFEVVNAAHAWCPTIDDPIKTLEKLLKEQCPQDAKLLMAHVRGEFSISSRGFDIAIRKHIRMVFAFLRALDNHAPDLVFLWNQFNALHRTFEAILKRRGIARAFFHDGVMPGSIALDVDGEMGESWIARDPSRFKSVKVTDEQVARAASFLDDLSGQENSRHPQDEHILVKEALAFADLGDRPRIFFAGQNDWHGGIKPNSPSRAHHSPHFSGSLEALVELDRIAGEMGLAVVFKPHPLSRDKHAFLRASEFPNTVILQHTSMNVCIDVCDVTATIASQASYVALQEGRPVLLLGRNQLSGKALTYDVDAVDGFEEQLYVALNDPLAPTRREDFATHVAQLERAYLFDYGTQDAGFYSRGVEDAARLINLTAQMPVDDVIDAIVAGDV